MIDISPKTDLCHVYSSVCRGDGLMEGGLGMAKVMEAPGYFADKQPQNLK
jgi:hypothetical protein